MAPERYSRSKHVGADDSSEAKTKNYRLVAWKQRKSAIDVYFNRKRCEGKRQKRYIPQEMLFDIFLRLPAQVLRDVMRHVCREWNLMIRNQYFIYHHLRNSSGGLMIQEHSNVCNAIYVEMRRGRLEICRFDYWFDNPIWTSCNGLVLAPDFRDPKMIAVINPLTKERTVLPPFSSRMKGYSKFCLAFVEASMEYKVVYMSGNESFGSKLQVVVLTIGVDKVWRHIDIEHLSLPTRRYLICSSFVTGGYIHWIDDNFVLTLNVETETIQHFPMPQVPTRGRQFLPMGNNLSIVYKSSEFLMDVWEMNPETGKWNMLLRFDFEPLSSRFQYLFPKNSEPIIPFGWLAVREVLLFSTSCIQKHCIAYNVKTREIQSFKFNFFAKSHHFQAHVNSLVWLEGGF